MAKKQSKKKTTNEKPVSLNPLEFREALKALLETPPPNDTEKEPAKKKA